MIRLLTFILAAALLTACSESTTPSPPPPSISAIHISAPTSDLVVGDKLAVRATATAADGSAVPLLVVAWTSSNIAVATVVATGLLTAEVRTINAGAVTITATAGSHSGQLALAMTPSPAPPPLQTSPSLAFIWTRESGMIALTPPGSGESIPMAINDPGQVVGYVVIARSAHAFVWTVAAGMVDIGGLAGSVNSYATAINNAGQVAGHSQDASGHNHAFRWSPLEGIIALDVGSGPVNSYAHGINSSGQVVGERDGPTGGIPFRWSKEKGMEDLALFESDIDGGARAIADNGDAVGYSGDGGYYGITRAVVWSADGTKKIIDICTTGSPFYGCYSSANAINNAGQIAGNSESGGPSVAFRLTVGGDRQDIFGLPGSHISFARGINEAGQVVGFTEGPPFPLGRAFLWSPTDGTIDLGTLPGRQWSDATGINNRGQVIGKSF